MSKENSTSLENTEIDADKCDLFGFSYDCPLIPHLHKTISYLAASSIATAKAIINKQCHVALNWFGGWHHGFKDEASGFCYTNDIVLMILTFLEHRFNRILYVDLDLHHGNAVEDAFSHTDKVVTFSIHKQEFGFFPGTGDIADTGTGVRGKYHSINMPLSDGVTDQQYSLVFQTIIEKLIPKYRPQVIICQCGGDTLSGDRMNSFNLTLQSYESCINKLLMFDIPIAFLGGGGYNAVNTAKLWTFITGIILGKTLDTNIPDHDLFLHYGPSYELTIEPSMRLNQNGPDSIQKKLETILTNIDKMSK